MSEERKVRVVAEDITETARFTDEYDSSVPAGKVIGSVVAGLGLPPNIPYGMRKHDSAEWLKESEPIGRYSNDESGQSVLEAVVTPKTHLGA